MSIPPIGIDLGTTYCCVGVWKGKIEIIPNELGNRTTPSVVSFTPQERLIGEAAKNNITRNVENTIYDAKRLIGRKFDDPIVQKDKELWPFRLEKDFESDRPQYVVEYKNETKRFYPEQISAMVLEKLKSSAEDYLAGPVTKAIITVPAYFNDSQRQATKDAGKIAGLNVERVMNEPTAAAIAYGLETDCQGPKNILVFDFGGGTLDISVLKIEKSKYKVLSVSGDTHLGGEDIDNVISDYLINEFLDKTGTDLKSNKKALRRLKIAAEKAKRELSFSQEATIDVDALADGEDLNMTITRTEFEDLCQDIFDKCIPPLDRAIEDSKLTRYDIEDVVLIGGTSRIPKISEILQDYFHRDNLCKGISPDEAIAYGAAVTANLMLNVEENDEPLIQGEKKEEEDEGIQRIEFEDATPLSLGIETLGGAMEIIIPRNTSIPCKKSKIFSTARDNQTSFKVEIFEGERKLTKDNHKLGDVRITGLPKKPRGKIVIKIILHIDKNGILDVNVQTDDMDSGKLTIKNDKGRLNQTEIERLIKEAERYKEDDMKRAQQIFSRNRLEQLYLDMKNNVLSGELKDKLSKSEINQSNFKDIITSAQEFKKRIEAEAEQKAGEIIQRAKITKKIIQQIQSRHFLDSSSIGPFLN